MIGPIQVQCVYGERHIPLVRDVLIPSLQRSSSLDIVFLAANYDNTSSLALEDHRAGRNVEVRNVRLQHEGRAGFAEAHNGLFQSSKPGSAFVIINPDCILQPGAIDALISRKSRADEKVAIVEGRQWPYDHPKEYDQRSLHTPWASGAFCLIDTAFFEEVGGLDPIYFLYLEDVDLSWRAWHHDYTVLHEPEAVVAHFSGHQFYRDDLVENELYYSLRNFLVISRKFFGPRGEQNALDLLLRHPDQEIARLAVDDFRNNLAHRISDQYAGKIHPHVKILGVNQFHQLRHA